MEPYKAPQQNQGAGTAFFINSDGYLLTNFHVVDQAKSVEICIPALGRKLIDATIVGICPESDVALLKIGEGEKKSIEKVLKKVPALQLGDSDALYPTEFVLALGYPMGQRYIKSTVGVVAGREYLAGRSYMHITAPINPGNSGGPLLNMDGKVVGINSAIIAQAQNIGYIVAINEVKIVLEDLHQNKLLRKPIFGANCNPTTNEHARSLKNPVPGGVYVNFVEPKSVADKLGVKAGDMLYGINDFTVDQYGDVSVNWRNSGKISIDEFLIRLPINAPLKLQIYRKGKSLSLKGPFDAPDVHPIRFVYPDYEPESIDWEMFGGICIQQLRVNHFDLLPKTHVLQQYMRPDNQQKEVLVATKVLPGSYIHKINCIFEGSILEKVNNIPVKNLAELRKALELSIKTGEISIRTEDKIETVLSLDSILEDENRISKDFMFNITDTVQKLKKLRREYLDKKANPESKSESKANF